MQNRDELQTLLEKVRQAGAVVTDQPAIAPARPVAPEFVIDVLRAEAEGVRKEISDLTSQLTRGVSDAREQAIQGQIASAQQRLESLQGQLDQLLSGTSRAGTQTSGLGPASGIPPEVENMAIWFFATCAVTIVSVALIRLWTRWLDRRGHPAPSSPEIAIRLDRMEQAIDAVAIEVERISEGQRFANQVMGELRALPAPIRQLIQSPAQREPVAVPRDDDTRP